MPEGRASRSQAPKNIFKKTSQAPCFFAKGDYYITAAKFSLSTGKVTGRRPSGRTQTRAGSPSGLDFTATCFGPEQKPAADPSFQRAGWALIAGSGDRCPLRCRCSEEGHGTFRTVVRRLPCGKIEKGSVILGSRGTPDLSPPGKEASGSPASFHFTPGLTCPEGAPGAPPLDASVGHAGPIYPYSMISGNLTAHPPALINFGLGTR